MKYDVFISYSRKDQVVVDEIRQLLDSNAITYWLDTEKVHMGSEFMADIVDAIENSTITLFISSSVVFSGKLDIVYFFIFSFGIYYILFYPH